MVGKYGAYLSVKFTGSHFSVFSTNGFIRVLFFFFFTISLFCFISFLPEGDRKTFCTTESVSPVLLHSQEKRGAHRGSKWEFFNQSGYFGVTTGYHLVFIYLSFGSGLVMEICCVSRYADVKSSLESFQLGFISFGIWNLSYFVIFVY